ncbi:MAG: glycosyltransferase [Desulfobacterales bacterium]|jgi:glycosyltransferase involved in cell wall biosynthesis|nr:glycosyltransferase [Desulfobacterales bacterium]
MKILHILDHSLPLHSGYTFRSQNLFRSQRKMGYHPVILTSPKHEASWKGESHSKETINGFDYYRTGAVGGSRLPILGELQLMAALKKRLQEVIVLEKPDIIHAHSPVLNALPALSVGKALNIPVVYEIRAFWEDAAVDHGTYAENSIKYRLTRAVETHVCKKAAHIAVLCNGLKQDLIARGIPSDKITPVFNGVNPDDFKPTPPDEEYQTAWNLEGKKVIGFIGSFYRYEGLDLLVSAFSRIASKHPSAVLLLVGGGEMEKELKAQINQLNTPPSSPAAQQPSVFAPPALSSKLPAPSSLPLSVPASQLPSFSASQRLRDSVIFSGRIPHERVPGVYAMIDILAYPRYAMRLTELVTPLKPLEAMAMGKALVASDVGGHKELIKHNETGLLFPAGDEKALSEALDNLLLNSQVRERLAQNGLTWARRYHTWEATTAVYAGMYERVIIKV